MPLPYRWLRTGATVAAALVTVLLLEGCARFPDVQSSYDHSVEFKHYQTFAWYRAEVPTRVGGIGPEFNVLLDQRLKEAVASELVKEGIIPATENPGLLVAYDIAVDPNLAPAAIGGDVGPGFAFGYSYWYGYRYRYDFSNLPDYMSIDKYKQGTLVIDLIDADTKELIWRGWEEANLNPTQIDETKINVVVANILAQFPPIPDMSR